MPRRLGVLLLTTYLVVVIFTVKGEVDQRRSRLQLRLPCLR